MIRAAGLRLRRSKHGLRQRVNAGIAFLLAVGCVAVALHVTPALAETKIKGKPVPDSMLSAIVVGATSCPALTGPRLAAQLMAASAFEVTDQTGTGQGLANLDDRTWKAWAPWREAQRSDVRANVLALAHLTCKNIGLARDHGVAGNPWEAAVAAESAGMDEVLRLERVPAGAEDRVATVAGYANWYADQPQFNGAEPSPSASVASEEAPVRVPDEYVSLVVKAGRICPAVLPPHRIAAQLMALSGFDPNLRSEQGTQGIAQFTDDMWRKYRPSAKASVWDPEAAIPAMGSAMCDIKNQLSAVRTKDRSADAYTLAVAAYQWGVTTVRAEGGVPRESSMPQLTDEVTAYAEDYRADDRLQADEPAPPSIKKPTPTPSGAGGRTPAPPTTEPKRSDTAKPKPSVKAKKTPTPKWDPSVSWQITNAVNGRVLDVPGDDNIAISGTAMQLWDNVKTTKDQFWHITDAPDAGFIVIVNVSSKQALGIRDGSDVSGAEVVMLDTVRTDPNQQWKLRDGDDGRHFIVNRKSGKVLDIQGDDCCADNGATVRQSDFQDYAVDQQWTLSR